MNFGLGTRRRLPSGRLVLLSAAIIVVVWAAATAIPPRTIIIETGPVGGGYYEIGLKYQALLSRQGLNAVIQPKADSLAIIADVEADTAGNRVGFAAQAIPPDRFRHVASLGQVEVQPLFMIYQAGLGELTSAGALRGRRIVMPPENSATSEAALSVLALFGVDPSNTSITFMPLAQAVGALEAGSFDVGMFLLSADNGFIERAVKTPTLRLLSEVHALAISRRLTFLKPITLPVGIYDLTRDIPPADMSMVGAPVDIVVRTDLNPSLGYALMEAMTVTHRGVTRASGAGSFPTPVGSALPILPLAATYYRTGVPWIHRELPRGLAVFVDRNLAIVLTLFVMTQIYSASKYFYELSYFSADQLGMLLLVWIYRTSARRRNLSERRLQMVQAIERMLLRQTNKQRRDRVIERIRIISGQDAADHAG